MPDFWGHQPFHFSDLCFSAPRGGGVVILHFSADAGGRSPSERLWDRRKQLPAFVGCGLEATREGALRGGGLASWAGPVS